MGEDVGGFAETHLANGAKEPRILDNVDEPGEVEAVVRDGVHPWCRSSALSSARRLTALGTVGDEDVDLVHRHVRRSKAREQVLPRTLVPDGAVDRHVHAAAVGHHVVANSDGNSGATVSGCQDGADG